MSAPMDALRHHVSGAVARGEAEPIVAVEWRPATDAETLAWLNGFLSLACRETEHGLEVQR